MRNVEEIRPPLGVTLVEVAESLDIRSARAFSIARRARNFQNTGLRDKTLLSSSQADRVIDYRSHEDVVHYATKERRDIVHGSERQI
jgi:hypothetical protein